ncbi:ABC transporter ATP-binding protein [Sinosporangium siamense]|uniref:ABC transporter ATP-binding protein n=1 Tax=Sinosporangium siamense TaxID=1367973 RepID=A0A919VCZ4_9ACTN|nr:ABC transporter ATP-binding protein [Sinosporangium siamense]GII93619.1 ABC transporter ATP-binding protein [Sinosporangium siamense]
MTTIQAINLTKRYGTTLAVDDLSFTIEPGRVTGFLGPNGAGKSTTMRMMLGLDRPSGGSVRVGGKPYSELRHPLRTIGALLDAKAVHGGRTARNHLLCLAQSNGIGRARVEEVMETVGLTAVAKRRVGGFSLGMGQRLGIAAALLGDPEILMFDEPVNGLDPEGIRWIRTLMRGLAAEGRTVFVSSHLMSEMAQTADHLIVIGKGRLIADTGVQDFIARSSQSYVRVRSPRMAQLAPLLTGAELSAHGDHMRVIGLPASKIGDVAAGAGIALHELTVVEPTLEAAYMELTKDSVEYAGETVPA